MNSVIKIIVLMGSFLVGSIPFAYILGKIFAHIDIRKIGSGNVGSTNLFRAAGKKVAFCGFILDTGKGLITVLVVTNLGFSFQFVLLCGALAVLGHIFPPYLNFKGGKGIATSFGVILGINPKIALILFSIFVVIFALSRIVSLASVASTLALVPISVLIKPAMISFSIFITILVIFTHRSNIKRLLVGAERRLI